MCMQCEDGSTLTHRLYHPQPLTFNNTEKRRCSATPVRRTPSSPLRFVAAAHAVMPWAFPGYHDESHAWLNFIDESHVQYYAELRDVSFFFFFFLCDIASLNFLTRLLRVWSARFQRRDRDGSDIFYFLRPS